MRWEVYRHDDFWSAALWPDEPDPLPLVVVMARSRPVLWWRMAVAGVRAAVGLPV